VTGTPCEGLTLMFEVKGMLWTEDSSDCNGEAISFEVVIDVKQEDSTTIFEAVVGESLMLSGY